MHRYLIRRLASIVPTAAFIASVVFVLLRLVPGDPALLILGMEARPEEAAALRRTLGLDRPLAVQYLHWLRALVTGDLGESLRFREPVARLLWERLPVTVSLTAGSMLVALTLSLPLGILAALRPWSAVDLACLVGAQIGLAIPSFWLGILLILTFAVTVRWFPLQGYASPADGLGVWARHLALPALALGVARAAVLMRLVRAAVLEEMHRDYVTAARAKGLSGTTVVVRHVIKNALIPVVTVAGLQLGFLLGGAIVIEQVFALPGLGRLLLFAISTRDFPLVQGAVTVIAIVFALLNLLVDLTYAYLDPRVVFR